MKYMRSFGLFALAAIAALFAALPVPPWGSTAEWVSSVLAFVVFCCLLFVPRFKLRRKRFAVFVGTVPWLRVFAELTWDVIPHYVPHSFFFLSGAIGADGEGAYNANSYQIFLILVVTAFVLAVVTRSNKSIETESLPAPAHLKS